MASSLDVEFEYRGKIEETESEYVDKDAKHDRAGWLKSTLTTVAALSEPVVIEMVVLVT